MEKCYLYIVLSRPGTMISKVIQYIKNDEYTHASISLDKDLENMYSFSRKQTFNPFIGQFKKEDINKGIFKFCKDLPGAIIEIEVSKQQYEKVKELLDHFISNSSLYKYNYMGLLHSLLNKPVCYSDRFLCSEFVYYIMKESGIIDFKISRNLVRPQILLNIEGKIIYKGNLKEIKFINNNWNTENMETGRLNIIYD